MAVCQVARFGGDDAERIFVAGVSFALSSETDDVSFWVSFAAAVVLTISSFAFLRLLAPGARI